MQRYASFLKNLTWVHTGTPSALLTASMNMHSYWKVYTPSTAHFWNNFIQTLFILETTSTHYCLAAVSHTGRMLTRTSATELCLNEGKHAQPVFAILPQKALWHRKLCLSQLFTVWECASWQACIAYVCACVHASQCVRFFFMTCSPMTHTVWIQLNAYRNTEYIKPHFHTLRMK